jgi:gamma-glutamyl-gamma-aminobutyrate hydrolase PuuD
MKYLLSFYLIVVSFSYPFFPTYLTVSIPISEKEHSISRVENNFVRWLQASGGDLIVVHPWTSHDDIDKLLLSKVNGVLFQGTKKIDQYSPYYQIVKYIYEKIIFIYNDSKGKKEIPILAVGNDLSLLASIASNDLSIISEYNENKPNNLIYTNSIDDAKNCMIFSELQNNDFINLQNKTIIPNYFDFYITKEIFLKQLNNYFNLIATSISQNNVEYASVIELKNYKFIQGISFHPEFIIFEQNTNFIIPENLESIKAARFIGNSFVSYGRTHNDNKMEIEEKLKNLGFNFIDPYGKYPVYYNERYQFLFSEL